MRRSDNHGYDAIEDPYCYPGTTLLRNIPDLRNAAALAAFEAASTTQRADEPLPGGRFGASHYRAIHRHLFQDVYPWAGKPGPCGSARTATHSAIRSPEPLRNRSGTL